MNNLLYLHTVDLMAALADPETDHSILLIDEPVDSSPPSWSPDGEFIVYSSSQGENLDLYKIRLNGAEITRLTQTDYNEKHPALSPDGSKLVFSSDREGTFDLRYCTSEEQCADILTKAFTLKHKWNEVRRLIGHLSWEELFDQNLTIPKYKPSGKPKEDPNDPYTARGYYKAEYIPEPPPSPHLEGRARRVGVPVVSVLCGKTCAETCCIPA